ncbi:MAG: response regulator transcription factor [Schwartzia sp.]|nr:response regulator transcription factor [Schwartzia sp. (in: firmicutes)]
MKIAVCDRDAAIREELVRLIRETRPEAEVRDFATGAALLRAEEEFSLVFLDIRGVSGLSVARRLRERGQRELLLIFVTGWREYVEEAFDLRAYHYLVKPVDPEKFVRVLREACREIEAAEARVERSILVRGNRSRQRIFLRDILFIESGNKRTLLHTSNGVVEARETMDALEATLGEGFFRCHRCYIVNFGKIAGYGPDSIRLAGGETILVSERRYADFVRAFLRYAKEGGTVNV